jgi:1,2-diacylglycerol 3-beta-galactosyltransferase
MSDTGGGHRAAAEAIEAAAAQAYAGQLTFKMVDVFREYTPAPFKYAPEIYPVWVNYAASTWQLTYSMTNAPRRSALSSRMMYYYWRTRIKEMLNDHPADLILSVHPIITRPVMRGLLGLEQRPPFVTVVTDLVSTHAFWYEPRVERCLVPTQAAYDRGLTFGVAAEKMRITGLPVHPKFTAGLLDKEQARQELGIKAGLPAVLLVSGGDGMGPLFEIVRAINQQALKCQLIIVAGRNQKLRDQLEAQSWNQLTQIYGFVDFMPKLMAACDMIVTKAGPATITEASIAGLPMIISGGIPGQEDGNIQHVMENKIGVYAPGPQLVAQAVAKWLKEPDKLQKRAARAKNVSYPQAVWDIVEEVYQAAQLPPVPTNTPPLRRRPLRPARQS